MFGISGGEFLVLVIVAALVIGPESIAQAMRALRRGVGAFRTWSSQLRAQTQGDFAGLSAQELAAIKRMKDIDLSQYDPRSMIREAVHEELSEWIKTASGSSGSSLVDAAEQEKQ